jgi:CRP/FNR family cyclic AMP-dependent transcriptional regulator
MAQQPATHNRFRSLQRDVITRILAPAAQGGFRRTLPAATVVDFDPAAVWWVTSGSACLEHSGREVMSLELGDILGPWLGSLSPLALATADSDACELSGVDYNTLRQIVLADLDTQRLWLDYQMALSSRFFGEFGELRVASVAPVPQYRHYAPGETIILEGADGDEVFVLLEGAAKVSVKGAAVGEIHRDEVFGALGALTEGPRAATVTADAACDCMVFNKQEFRDLLRASPELMEKLFHDFARALHDMNDSMLRASHTKWRNLF